MSQTQNNVLISVYGSLRSKMYNNRLLKDSEMLGTFNTEPIFELYDLGSFPGLKPNGKTSIVMEVYSVDEQTAKNVDRLEGYTPGGNNTFYDKIKLMTPWGESSVYIYVNDLPEERLVKSGDWREHLENNTLATRYF